MCVSQRACLDDVCEPCAKTKSDAYRNKTINYAPKQYLPHMAPTTESDRYSNFRSFASFGIYFCTSAMYTAILVSMTMSLMSLVLYI